MAAAPPSRDTVNRARVPYAGIATRAVALAIDVAIAQAIVFAGGAVLALVGSLVTEVKLDDLGRLLAAAAWPLVFVSYFVLFWSTTGQTPGMRIMGLRVVTRGRGASRHRAVAGPPRRPRARDRAAVRGVPAGAGRRPPARPAGLPRRHRRPLRRGSAPRRARVGLAAPGRLRALTAARREQLGPRCRLQGCR